MVLLRRVFVVTLLLLLCGCQDRQLYKDNRLILGTYIEVASPYKQAPGIVFEEIKRIEKLLSKFDPDSEIFILNKTGRLRVAPETFEIIKKSKEFYELSGGAFDITVAPLMELWGFTLHRNGAGFTGQESSVPEEGEISRAMKIVGSDKIILHEEDNVVEFKFPNVEIDLGAIAKGYSLDRAVKKLKENHIDSCLINAGGQVFCLGDKFGRPWKVGIRGPREDNLAGEFELTDKSVATAGDYEQYFIQDQKRYPHIIDPRTGYPVSSGVISATVIAQEATTADALATAIFVLGREKGEGLARDRFPAVEVKIIEEKDL